MLVRIGMTIKKPEQQGKIDKITCPNCRAKITIEDMGMVMFESCTVFSCPVCEKTIAIQPKGEEFKIDTTVDDEESTESNNESEKDDTDSTPQED
jgi:ribosomal protein S27E